MFDATVFGQCGVEMSLIRNIERNNQVDIVIAVTKFDIFLGNGSAVWSDEDFDVVAIDFVAQVVSLVFVEGDNKILETVRIGFEGFFGLEKFDGIGNRAREDSGRVLIELIENKSKAKCGRKLVDRRVFRQDNEDIRALANTFDDLRDCIARIDSIGVRLATGGVVGGAGVIGLARVAILN